MGRRDACPTFSQGTHKLEPLAFAAGERVNRLAEPEVAEADFFQQPQLFDSALRGPGVGKASEKPDDFIHRRVEEIGDGPGFFSGPWSVVSCFPAMRLLTT